MTRQKTKNILYNIDDLVRKFCDNSVDCDSLNSLHTCMEDILNEGYNVSARPLIFIKLTLQKVN